MSDSLQVVAVDSFRPPSFGAQLVGRGKTPLGKTLITAWATAPTITNDTEVL